jgi:hypothetical protein
MKKWKLAYIYKSNLGPSNSDGSNLFESPANFSYIFKLKKNPTILHDKLQLKQTTKFRNVQMPLKA